jgi:hypothetical protein
MPPVMAGFSSKVVTVLPGTTTTFVAGVATFCVLAGTIAPVAFVYSGVTTTFVDQTTTVFVVSGNFVVLVL